ncbi:Wadjet anti-phage system protein JetD domain-containing protein [Sinomonas mesophila]|uniref:Wadjet anti-phage system protein JetD domain-containing protein n=1 Tax=Sinomonas mesophila TaxID=1531955 RepID=UPI00158B7115|nr:Wadjet anti-phage system protein JetD domain-containing protein [Sinomonas mesophila]
MTVAAARSAAAKKYEKYVGSWAVERPDAPALALPLHPPTERTALADQASAVGWVRSWAGQHGVEWGERAWASLGRQSVPVRLVLTRPDDVASFAGRVPHWHRASSRARSLIGGAHGGDPARARELRDAVVRSIRAITDLDDADFGRLADTLAWLSEHPESGLYIRQLPIRGVDTKWVGRHEPLVARLHRAATGREDLGLAPKPDLIRMRFLDPALAPGGLCDVAAPLSEAAGLAIRPRTVFVFENLESVLAMPPWHDAIVVHGSGYAVERISRLPWVETARLVYWGDLDTHGFAILNRLRAQALLPHTVLMDLATLDAFTDLWVPEPTPAMGALTHLDPDELAVVTGLSERGGIRLEQERIPWAHALEALRRSSEA